MGALFNNPLFETIICLVLAFALLSLLTSSLLELINTYFQERGNLLFKSITGMFSDNINVNFGQLLFSLPNVNNLKKDRESLPQYLSKEMFSTGIIDTISNYARVYKYSEAEQAIVMQKDSLTTFDRFAKGVESMEHTALKLQLLNMIERSGAASQQTQDTRLFNLQNQLEGWFSDQMERTSGWYKSLIRWRLFFVGLFVALTLNVDSIHLFQTFYRSPALRVQMLPIAEQLADNYAALKADSSLTDLQRAYRSADSVKLMINNRPGDSSSLLVLDQVLSRLQKIDSITRTSDTLRIRLQQQIRGNAELVAGLGLPIGWMHSQAPLSWFGPKNAAPKDYFERYQQASPGNVISYILGIFITAVSLQFGAPFWFDLLLKAVNIRRAGAKPNEPK